MKKLIKCGKLFLGKDEKVLEHQSILVDGNRIVEVGPWDHIGEADAEVIDLSDKFVMPGLIDTHLHVMMDGVPGELSKYGSILTMPGTMFVNAMENAQKDLMAGFTTIRDEGAGWYVDVSLRDAINQGKVKGPRMKVSGRPIGSTGGHADSHYIPEATGLTTFGMVCDGPAEVTKAARTILKYGADQIKLMATGGVMSVGDAPGAAELTYEEMKAAIDVAKVQGKTTTAHAHGAEGIKNAVKAGITTIEHGMLMDEECMDLMVEHGTYLVPTIIAAQQICEHGDVLPQDTVEKANVCINNHGKNLQKCREKGVKIAFGTDAGTYFNHHGQQAREFAYMQRFAKFTTAECLLSATKVASELMGMEKEIGSIEEGKFADIVAFQKSPFDDITTLEKCEFVMKDGEVFKQ